jgi:hypothetical protein
LCHRTRIVVAKKKLVLRGAGFLRGPLRAYARLQPRDHMPHVVEMAFDILRIFLKPVRSP